MSVPVRHTDFVNAPELIVSVGTVAPSRHADTFRGRETVDTAMFGDPMTSLESLRSGPIPVATKSTRHVSGRSGCSVILSSRTRSGPNVVWGVSDTHEVESTSYLWTSRPSMSRIPNGAEPSASLRCTVSESM